MVGQILLYLFVGLPVLLVALHTIIRIVRYFYKFPMPEFLANAIDNPFRRRLQPPDETAVRHGIQPGMQVLDVGPGNGTYTMGASRRVGENGKVVAIDIEPKMIERIERRIKDEGVSNVEARVADVYKLPFDDGSFDLLYMISVIGEIPDPIKAMHEFRRVLKTGGRLVFSELLLDPDYPLASSLIRNAGLAGFRLKEKIGNFFYYTLILEVDQV